MLTHPVRTTEVSSSVQMSSVQMEQVVGCSPSIMSNFCASRSERLGCGEHDDGGAMQAPEPAIHDVSDSRTMPIGIKSSIGKSLSTNKVREPQY